MANAWGELSWSTGSWGQQNDVSVSLTGQQLNNAQGNVGVSAEINEGWGRLTWGENAWGIAGDVLVTGIGVSAGIGTGSVTIDVTVDDVVTGQQLNIGLNSVQLLLV
jgi:4-aminobutyrate aminotransferase-like enzyme